ncbi:MAG: DUF1289 domain-containing protein [Myxococcota bacterium]|nr:DUF1289 domain-containing protein [Myxococcota bacterium]
MSKRSKSPCIDVCTYTGPKGWCVGCGLTRSESQGWRGMKPYDRTALLKQLQRRQAELKTLNRTQSE